MAQSPLRWGLLSTARINRQLIPAIRAAPRCELVAVASRDLAHARAYAAEWDIPRAHGSYEALLQDPDIDAVYIALPNALHAEWTIRAAQAGKHVLCEKPLTTSVEACDRVSAAAASAGVVVMEALMYLYHPFWQQVRAMVQAGTLGEVLLARGSFTFFLERPVDVRRDPALGGGSLWDVGIYPLSFLRWLWGEPQEVFGWQQTGASGVDETFAGLLRYEHTLGLLDCGFRQRFRNHAEIAGSEATLIMERPFGPFPERALLRTREGEEVLALPEGDGYRGEVEALTAAALDGRPPLVALSWSRANVAAIEALYASARLGRPLAPASAGP